MSLRSSGESSADPRADRRRGRLLCRAPPADDPDADPDALRIAVDALLENAVKYTETGDTIELQAREEGEGLVIEVADSGPGVPLDATESIFQRSSRAQEGERPGLGIGLAIVDAIATAHGGSCTLEPSVSVSRFALRLPGFEPAALEAKAQIEA